jgi:hypothetical protein
LAAGAAVMVSLPGLAYANSVCAEPPTLITVRTPGATFGPTSTFSEISTHADCTGGLISDGGISQTYGPDVTDMTSNGNHINGTEPSVDGSSELLTSPGVVATDVTHWLGIGGSGGATEPAFSSTPYAICLTSSVITHTQVVMNTVPIAGLTVASCPTGTRLLGGGARATPASSGSMKPVAGFPTFNDSAHDFGKKAAADGELNPDSWTAVGFNGGGGGTLATYAFAICTGTGVNISTTNVKVRWTEAPGPYPSSTHQSMTIGCGPADGKLIGGGAAISGGNVTGADFTAGGSQGDHLTGSYPSDSAGNPVTDGTTTAAFWTAVTHTGGVDSNPPTASDVWAMCLGT